MDAITYEVVREYGQCQRILVRDARGPRPVWRPGWRDAGGRFRLPAAQGGWLVGSLDYVVRPAAATLSYRTRAAALTAWHVLDQRC